MWVRPTKRRDESGEENDYKTKIKRGSQGDKNEKPEFISTEDPGDTAVSTLAGVLASHI
jgi:hypothetical protein